MVYDISGLRFLLPAFKLISVAYEKHASSYSTSIYSNSEIERIAEKFINIAVTIVARTEFLYALPS